MELLNKMRINFYLSNYKKVLDVWKEVYSNDVEIEEEYKSEFLTIIQRTILKFFKNDENLYHNNSEYFDICQNSFELYSNFMAPLISEVTFEELDKKFNEIQNLNDNYEDDLDYQIIFNHICFSLRYYDKIIKINKKYKYSHLEYKVMIMRAFLNNNQIEEAKNRLDEIKNFEEEDVLIELAEVEYLIKTEKFNEAMEILEELRHKHGDYPKILNLISSCFIGTSHFDKATEILKKLYKILQTNIKDNTEWEICIKNLITLNILNNTEEIKTKDLISKLKELTDSEDPLITQIETINNYLN